MVGTSLTAGQFGIESQVVDVLDGKHRGLIALFVAFSSDQSCTESTHDTCDIRADTFAAGDLFETAEYGIVVERTTLYNNIFTEFTCIGELDYLKQSILDNGIGKTGRDICNGCALFLRLFYLGVHEYGTTGTKIDRVFRKQSLFREILNREV